MRVPNEIKPIIGRAQMPQIDYKTLGQLLVWLGEQIPGLHITTGYIDPRLLFYHQDIDTTKAINIPFSVLSLPVVLSLDNALIDGNHRAYRHVLDKSLVPFLRLNMTFREAIRVINNYSELAS